MGEQPLPGGLVTAVVRAGNTVRPGEVTSFEVIARYVEALGGRLDLVADFGDRTIRLPVTATETAAA